MVLHLLVEESRWLNEKVTKCAVALISTIHQPFWEIKLSNHVTYIQSQSYRLKLLLRSRQLTHKVLIIL